MSQVSRDVLPLLTYVWAPAVLNYKMSKSILKFTVRSLLWTRRGLGRVEKRQTTDSFAFFEILRRPSNGEADWSIRKLSREAKVTWVPATLFTSQ